MAEAIKPDTLFPKIVAVYGIIMIIGGAYMTYKPYRAPVAETVTIAPAATAPIK
jgi:hypothetical protein